MSHTQHAPIIVSSMGIDFTQAHIDGTIPMSQQEIDALVASAWFKSLNEGQRALYVVCWFNWLAAGSNQHKRRVRKDTPRFAAEVAQNLIQHTSITKKGQQQ